MMVADLPSTLRRASDARSAGCQPLVAKVYLVRPWRCWQPGGVYIGKPKHNTVCVKTMAMEIIHLGKSTEEEVMHDDLQHDSFTLERSGSLHTTPVYRFIMVA